MRLHVMSQGPYALDRFLAHLALVLRHRIIVPLRLSLLQTLLLLITHHFHAFLSLDEAPVGLVGRLILGPKPKGGCRVQAGQFTDLGQLLIK